MTVAGVLSPLAGVFLGAQEIEGGAGSIVDVESVEAATLKLDDAANAFAPNPGWLRFNETALMFGDFANQTRAVDVPYRGYDPTLGPSPAFIQDTGAGTTRRVLFNEPVWIELSFHYESDALVTFANYEIEVTGPQGTASIFFDSVRAEGAAAAPGITVSDTVVWTPTDTWAVAVTLTAEGLEGLERALAELLEVSDGARVLADENLDRGRGAAAGVDLPAERVSEIEGDAAGALDVEEQPLFPYRFVLADAVEYVREHGHEYDAIHASPPCQKWINRGNSGIVGAQDKRPDLITPIREVLEALGVPYSIENVPGAASCGAMRKDVELCGSMFRLPLRRHRVFELSTGMMLAPPHDHTGPIVGCYGHLHGAKGAWPGQLPDTLENRRRAIGAPWMDAEGCAQAIPPAYTGFVGRPLLAEVKGRPTVQRERFDPKLRIRGVA